LARKLTILPRFKRDYQAARKHSEFDAETLEYVFDVMISGGSYRKLFWSIASASATSIGLVSRSVTLARTSFSFIGFAANQ